MPAEKLNITLSTKIPHFLNEEGEIPEELSPQGKKLIQYLGNIVRLVSGSRKLYLCEPVRCRRKIQRKPCPGNIAAWTKDASEPIQWGCLECGEGGIIYDWQGTLFDESNLRIEREIEYERKGIWVGGSRLDEISVPLGSDQGGSLSWSAGLHASASSLADGEVFLSIPAALLAELYRLKLISQDAGILTLKLGQGHTRQYTTKSISYSTDMYSMAKIVLKCG